MLAYSLKRLVLAFLVVLTVSGITFTLTNAAIDPAKALAGESATAADIEAIRKAYGFDRAYIVQYADWLGSALTGQFGESFRMRRPVATLLAERLPVTMTLGVCALAFALLLSIPLGVVAALKPNSAVDRVALSLSVLGQALPTFWFALMMIILFGVVLRWLPISGSDTWLHFVMPSVALGYYATPAFMRLTRAGMIEVLASDYIRTARAKGLRPGTVLFKHALRNAVIPVVSLAAVQFGFMLGGSVVIETIFALHGVGFLAWESISRSDIPVVQAIVLLISLFYIVLTLVADLLNAYLDPRIRVA
ncbi:ABC transporter permease [Stella sp.]|uniref:ABC transporter permease n=1 Tax=Stella sp. TaxID=2912054 RepID=UPI0035AF2924